MEQIKRYKAVLTGNVQGVGLRIFVVGNASELGITGWVKICQMELLKWKPKVVKLI